MKPLAKTTARARAPTWLTPHASGSNPTLDAGQDVPVLGPTAGTTSTIATVAAGCAGQKSTAKTTVN